MKPLIITLMALGLVLSLQYTNKTKQVKTSPTAIKAVVQAIEPIRAAKVVFKATKVLPKPVKAAPPPAVIQPVEQTPPPVPQIAAPAEAPNDAKMWIYMHESGNNPAAVNSQGCRGLGQACPGTKLPCDDDYACQDAYFTSYMQSRYGSWENAKEFWENSGWW